MPVYVYACPACPDDSQFEKSLRITESSTPQNCPICGAVGKKLIVGTSFVLKGDGWPGKNISVKGQMAAKNRRLDSKMKERPAPVTLAPNVDGERTGTWAEAQKLAASKGKDTASYAPLINKESTGS